ncbi:MAG: hypothetical protein KatS3mg009_3212 [Acidimicrobiia bacterium]|nr:MAG: hypothetical protein KatS3mg009_3212 [Acidimicrobiia bacterium]
MPSSAGEGGPRPRAAPARDLGLAALAAVAFGCTVLFQRAVARDGLAASVALGVRFAFAGALLLAVLALTGRPVLPPRGERVAALVLGCVVYALESTFFYLALERGTAAAVALIFYAYPAVVAAVEAALGRTSVGPRLVAALALAIGGSACVALGGGDVAITGAGVACVVGSIVAFSVYVLAGDRLLVRTDPLTAAAWTAIGAASGVTIGGAVRAELEAPSGGALAALLANGAATAAAFTLFFVVLGRIGPTRTAIVMALEAVAAVVLAALFLGEDLQGVVVLGGAAVLAGAVLASSRTPPRVELIEGASPP